MRSIDISLSGRRGLLPRSDETCDGVSEKLQQRMIRRDRGEHARGETFFLTALYYRGCADCRVHDRHDMCTGTCEAYGCASGAYGVRNRVILVLQWPAKRDPGSGTNPTSSASKCCFFIEDRLRAPAQHCECKVPKCVADWQATDASVHGDQAPAPFL
jgi:hypothetical protein